MIGRSKELEHLYSLYESNSFEYLVMYGRRRVGKSTILLEFCKNTNSIYYPAKEKNDPLNLLDFSKIIQLHFEGTYISPFDSWEAAFDYISKRVIDRTAIIIDEFPYIAEENESVKSILQHAIDLSWKYKNIFLILCGSSIKMMEEDVMGSESPLHDRQTSKMEVKPFDYFESALFFPSYSNEDKIIAYGILGGVPRYLEAFDINKEIDTNIETKIVKEGSFLHEETENVLKAELRDTNVYNSILAAISIGKNRPNEIADYIHEEKTKVSKYLIKLQALRIVEKIAPCGEPDIKHKSIYVISDNFFSFYFRCIFSNSFYFTLLGEKDATKEIMKDIPSIMGYAFERVAKEYLLRKAKERKLPFVPYDIGRWWGNNPYIKNQDDVDVLAIDKTKKKAIFMECKFTSSPMPIKEYDDLVTATKAFPYIEEKYLYFLSRSGYTEEVRKRAETDGTVLLSIDDLFS